MVRILVTGASGRLGRELVKELLLQDFSVIAASRQELDICDADCTAGAVADTGVKVVVNCAGFTDVDRAEKDAQQAWASNALGPGNLAAVCGALKIPLIQLSSAYVFGSSTGEPRREHERMVPEGVFAKTMLQGEMAVRKSQAPYLIVRTSALFGGGGDFIEQLLAKARERKVVPVPGDLLLNPTPLKALAVVLVKLCILSLNQDFQSWGIYHFAGMPSCSWSGFAQMVFNTARECGILDHAIKVREVTSVSFPGMAFRPRDARLDCRKMQQVLGISMPNWQEYLKDALSVEQAAGKTAALEPAQKG